MNNKDIAHGVNSQIELAAATSKVFLANAEKLMNAGVIFIDPKSRSCSSAIAV